jgi:ABC-type bacteriocin/lantibiotic exporter with double-glycine peptidase domain
MNKPFSFRRVRFVPQMEVTECGAASLAMVLDYHGKAVPLSHTREACGVGRDGVSAARIFKAAAGFGLVAQAFKADIEQLHELALPAIVHWEFNHFVVLERIAKRAYLIVDPALGRRRLGVDEFSRAFTGVVLTFAPGPEFVRERRRSKSLEHYAARLATLRSTWLTVLAAALLLELLGLTFPALTQVLVDHVLVPQRDNWYWPLVALLCASGLSILAVTAIRDRVLRRLHFALDVDLMSGFTAHLLSLPLTFFQQRTAGDLLSRVDAQKALRDLALKAVTSVLDGFLVLGYAAMILAYDLTVGATIFAIAILRLLVVTVLRARMVQASATHLAELGRELSAVVEPLSAPELIRAFGAEDLAQDTFERKFVARLNAEVRRDTLNQRTLELSSVVDGFAQAAVIWLAGSRVLDDQMTLGVFAGLVTLQGLLQKPLGQLVEAAFLLTRARAVLARIDDVLDTVRPARGEQVLREVRGELALEGVSFRYDPHAPPICCDVTVRIRPGEKVAIVGRSGQGKTTLLRLLTGLVEPSAGKVLLDGVDMRSLRAESLAEHVGVVLQEPFLIDDSVRSNLTLGQPDANERELRRATRLAAVDHVIDALPEGYDTRLGENGARLSGGEKQRLALARALVRRPKVLLLDEATSSLDLDTEARLHANLRALACTRVLVAHRMETVRDADRILVVEGGRVVAEGTFSTLLQCSSLFRALTEHMTEVAA